MTVSLSALRAKLAKAEADADKFRRYGMEGRVVAALYQATLLRAQVAELEAAAKENK